MKLFKTLLVGFATGAAATYFLKTKEGQEKKEQLLKSVDNYKSNPEDYLKYVKEKASEYTNTTVATFKDYKEKFETGELTADEVLKTVKEKATRVADLAHSTIAEATGQDKDLIIDADEVEAVEESEATVASDDIIITYDDPVPDEDLSDDNTFLG